MSCPESVKKYRASYAIPLLWTVAIVLLSSFPYIAGTAAQHDGAVFAGFTFNIDDAFVYTSWTRQVADGNMMIYNRFTSEPQSAGQFNIFFVVLGLIVKFTHLSPTAVFHLARILLGITLLMLIWRFSGRFLKDPIERLLIVPVVGLSAGIGWMMPSVVNHQGPVDLWQPEAITFLSIYLNPLFLIGLILMIASFHFLYKMKEMVSWRYAVMAGLMLLLLGNIHTYDVATVGAVWAAYLLAKIIKERSIPWKVIGLSVVAAVIAIPSIGYQLYLYKNVEVFQLRANTPAPSPALWAYLAGYGLLLIFAVIGAWTALKERRGALILVVWSIIGFALPYAPIAQQRKLIMGLHIPLAILATIAIVRLTKKMQPKFGNAIAILMVLALVPSNLFSMARDIRLLGEDKTAPLYHPYILDSDMQALKWLCDHTDRDDVVLAFPDIALYAPTIAGNRVYYGHWSETPDYKTKINEFLTFIDVNTPNEWREDFLRRSAARYIIYFSNPDEQTLQLRSGTVQLVDLTSTGLVESVFEAGDTAVYKVKD